jgi:hypothetical protein
LRTEVLGAVLVLGGVCDVVQGALHTVKLVRCLHSVFCLD